MKNLEILKVYKNLEIYEKLMCLKEIDKKRQIVFLCVGNFKIWFDSFGPIFGSLLKLLDFKYYIYGNIKSNITAKNINEYIDIIYKFHNNPYVIVIDNAVSNEEKPTLKIYEGETQCACLDNNGVLVGDLGIIYCLNKKNIKKPQLYYEMIKEIKTVVRWLQFILT